MKLDYMKGAKGGGGGGGAAPTNTPDSLRSKDTMEVILALGEGPWEGLSNGSKSFFIGDTQLQNDNGEFNFKTFVLNFFPGVDSAAPVIPTLGGQSTNTAVNVTLINGTPVTRQTSQLNIDFIDVRIVFQRLMKSTSAGTFTADAEYKIEYKAHSSDTWITAGGENIKINGKTSSNYVKEHRIPVARISETYDIRVSKISPENTEEFFCAMGWESFQETISTNIAYDNTALIQLAGEASDQFSSIPQWSGIYKCLIIKVPANYDPITRVYDGIWDGSWKMAWTDNPAWCLYDFIMNDRYGMRSYYQDVNLDKYDVYEAAQWCDEPVPNGQGGTQPRYTFSSVISEARQGKELARYIAGAFNSTFFDDLNGKAFLRVDKDDDAAHIFSKETVTVDGFEYGYTDITNRQNDITVTFINKDLNWQEDRRRVFDQVLIDKNGRTPLDFIAVGCTNEHEALRRAQYKLITANTETCIVTFQTNRYGGMVNPFDVILICDPDMGYGISGRLATVSEDRLSATLRTPIYLESGVTYFITFTLNNGDKFKVGLSDPFPGYTTNLAFLDELPANLSDRPAFALEADGIIGLPRPFRVTTVDENAGNPDAISIQAISINRNKWYDADNLTDSGTIQYSALPDPFNPPGPVTCGFEERFIKDLKQFHITISPQFNRGAYKYYMQDHSFEVWSRLSGTNDGYVKRQIWYEDTLIDHPAGLYDFKILGKSFLGGTTKLETAPVYIFNVTNPMAPPAPIDWIKINKREVYWGYGSQPDDFAGFVLRYHNQANRTTWDDAAQPHQGLLSATSFYTSLIPPSARVIMVRPIDVFGVVSDTSAIIYRDITALDSNDITEDFIFAPTFSGTKEGCSVISGELVADDTGEAMYSGVPTAFFYDGGDLYVATYQEMIYYDEINVTTNGDLIVVIDFDGSGYELSIRDVGDTVWQPVPERLAMLPGDYEVKLRVFGGPTRGVVREFTIEIDAEPIIEDVQDVTIPAYAHRIPVTKTFGTIKIVSVTIQDTGGATATGFRVLDKDPVLGPLIELLDASGTVVGGFVDATIKGY